MKPTFPIYPNYEPLTDEESAELTRLIRKAVGVGHGCGVFFRSINLHELHAAAPQYLGWQDHFIRFGQQLTRVQHERAAEIQQYNPSAVREKEWGGYRSKFEVNAEQLVAQAIARGE